MDYLVGATMGILVITVSVVAVVVSIVRAIHND